MYEGGSDMTPGISRLMYANELKLWNKIDQDNIKRLSKTNLKILFRFFTDFSIFGSSDVFFTEKNEYLNCFLISEALFQKKNLARNKE